jgi:hypothetical protein
MELDFKNISQNAFKGGNQELLVESCAFQIQKIFDWGRHASSCGSNGLLTSQR